MITKKQAFSYAKKTLLCGMLAYGAERCVAVANYLDESDRIRPDDQIGLKARDVYHHALKNCNHYKPMLEHSNINEIDAIEKRIEDSYNTNSCDVVLNIVFDWNGLKPIVHTKDGRTFKSSDISGDQEMHVFPQNAIDSFDKLVSLKSPLL